MIATKKFRLLVGVVAMVLPLFASIAHAQPISLSPAKVNPGTSPMLTISSTPTFLDLARVSESQIAISPADGVSKLHIVKAGPERLAISFELARTAAPGNRTLNIKLTDDVTIAIRLIVDPAVCQKIPLSTFECKELLKPSPCFDLVCTAPK